MTRAGCTAGYRNRAPDLPGPGPGPGPHWVFITFVLKFMIDNKSDSYFKDIIEKGLRRFIEYQIMQFDDYKSVDIHYVGSIAHYLKEDIVKVGKEYNLKTSKFVKKPIEGLVDYHKKLLIKN